MEAGCRGLLQAVIFAINQFVQSLFDHIGFKFTRVSPFYEIQHIQTELDTEVSNKILNFMKDSK